MTNHARRSGNNSSRTSCLDYALRCIFPCAENNWCTVPDNWSPRVRGAIAVRSLPDNDASSMQRDSLAFEFLVFVTSGLTNWRLIRQECMAWGVEEYHLVSAPNQTRLTSCSYLQDVQHVQFGALTNINTRFFVAASHGPCDRKQCQRFGAQILSQLMNQTAQLPCQRERFDNNRGNEVKSCQ